ncbi:thioredoxin-like protein [Trichophaea hybrida]|nr:thioredoxin-like protein [Trichophaea hybrida]
MLLLRELAITSLLLLGSAEAAFYSKNSAVIQLDNKNFKKEIIDSINVAVVEFYAPWCGHCQNLKPVYNKLAESLQGIVKVAAIDCDDEKNKRTCGEHGVQGFPTLKIFKPSKTKGKPSVEDYNGERTAKAISDAVLKRVPDHVTKLTGSTFDDFLEKKNETAKAILFTNKAKTSPLWKSMAIDFLGVISFGQVHEKEKEVVEKFGIIKYPTIVFLPGGDAEGVVYEGQLKKAGLSEFFSKYESPKSDPWETEESSSSSSSSSSATSSSAAPKATEKRKPYPQNYKNSH